MSHCSSSVEAHDRHRLALAAAGLWRSLRTFAPSGETRSVTPDYHGSSDST